MANDIEDDIKVVETLPFKELSIVVPFVASSFAFAYVVGYFYAFDISWFPFFSFSEHLVFALRALPIAIGASVGFLILLAYSEGEHQWKWVEDKKQWFYIGWLCALAVAALFAIVTDHVGLFASFLLVAAGAYVYRNLCRRHSMVATGLYWAINLAIVSLFVGFVSGNAWRVYKLFPISPAPVRVETTDKTTVTGRVIFAGNTAVLMYDHCLKGVRLVPKKDINDIHECVHPYDCTDSALACRPVQALRSLGEPISRR
jgi:hypothetical protein